MSGYDLSESKFASLVGTASRHHRKQIAGWLSLTTRTRRGAVTFLTVEGDEMPLSVVHHAIQADTGMQRWAYNLWMNYAHFG